MKTVVTILTAVVLLRAASSKEFETLDHLRTRTDPETQTQAVLDLIQRLIPDRAKDFSIVIKPDIGPKNRDTFKLLTVDGQLSITGTSGVAAAWGFYYYLSQYCHSQVSWAGQQVSLPRSLPVISSPGVTVTSNDRWRYYQNVCTVSYSFVWWDWSRWEREIDWMAMNGINLPLAFNGQEAIWQRVYLKLGFTQEELDQHFGGPAFLAWSRMGNMHGWGGPLSDSWHNQQVALQHRILTRMRSLGITPVLPAFAGHVPLTITRLYPNVSVTRLRDWGHFNSTYCCTALLDLEDPLFTQIGKAFVTEYTKEFGTDHIYNTDTFNEMKPKSSDPGYLKKAGEAVYKAMTEADPQAIWLMQGWLFLDKTFWGPTQVKALLTSVPLGHMIVLDLYSEVMPLYQKLKSYYGQPFIWCMLHDFGGTVSMYGVVETVNKGPFLGRSFPGSTMVGTGLTPEGINQNEAIYNFMLENSWRKQPRNVTQWAQDYATSRYGQYNQYAIKAWQIFMSTVYNCTTGYHDNSEGNVIIITHPSLDIRQRTSVYNCTSGYQDFSNGNVIVITKPKLDIRQVVWYDPETFFNGWDFMIKAANNLTNSQLFRYDLVDVTRQALQLVTIDFYSKMVTAFKQKRRDNFNLYSSRLLSLLTDLDHLLLTDSHFLLGSWLESTKSLATTAQDRALYEYNARTQVTTWGPREEILDYANKQWSGLVSGYYKPRWALFISELSQALTKGVSFRQSKFDTDCYRLVEEPFTRDKAVYPSAPQGDQIAESKAVHKAYRPTTKQSAKFYRQILRWSSGGSLFVKHATHWLKKQSTNRYHEDNSVYSMENGSL